MPLPRPSTCRRSCGLIRRAGQSATDGLHRSTRFRTLPTSPALVTLGTCLPGSQRGGHRATGPRWWALTDPCRQPLASAA